MDQYPANHRCHVCRCSSEESIMVQWSRRRNNGKYEAKTYCMECRAEIDLANMLVGRRLVGNVRMLMGTYSNDGANDAQ